jgi:hypothetical protein
MIRGVFLRGATVTDADRFKLLFGPYQAPALRRGDRASCLVRDCLVVVTTWTDARIPWPRCRQCRKGRGSGGGSGLLVDEELAHAVRTESAAALSYWWGVGHGAIARWRMALGVGKMDSPGSRRLIRAASAAGGAASRTIPLPPEEVERRRRIARELDLGQHLQTGYHGPWWSAEQLVLLGTDTDEAVAALVGRTANAVRVMRTHLGIPSACDRRRRAASVLNV